eukprot:gene5676-6556_t
MTDNNISLTAVTSSMASQQPNVLLATTTTTTTTTTSSASNIKLSASSNSNKAPFDADGTIVHSGSHHSNLSAAGSSHDPHLPSGSVDADPYDIFYRPLNAASFADLGAVASSLSSNEPIIQLIVKKILSPSFAQNKEELLCRWFYSWYNLDNVFMKKFVLTFVPALLWVYLYNQQSIMKVATTVGIEAVLVCIYNHELLRREGREQMFHAPIMSLPSFIYKSVSSEMESGLTESSLKQINALPVVVEKSLPRIDTITATSRPVLLRTVLGVYNSHITSFTNLSRVIYCEMCTRVAATGMPFLNASDTSPEHIPFRSDSLGEATSLNNSTSRAESGLLRPPSRSYVHARLTSFLEFEGVPHHLTNGHTMPSSSSPPPPVVRTKRIFLNESVYKELITGLSYCVFQDNTKSVATIALTAINQRACHDLVPEVMLYTNALTHILHVSSQPSN